MLGYYIVYSDHVTTRMDNSLLVTTKKFLELKNLNESVNLNDAAETLNVPKRRLYDITNVLEGIDLVEKIGKNSIRWKTNDGDGRLLEALQFEFKLVREDPTYKPYGYLQLQDLQSLDIFSNQTLIAVKSFPEVQPFIEVADPSKTGKFQIKVRTDNYSPLRAFLCPSYARTHSSIEEILSTG
ncbi:Transcription factor E2F3 [Trichostrongylus colubriformis]|uniref:Transcription factor E2F3 n=1 Tax=Trichostrongylus colubriformis TaxID=6319 RepID=A0AAN8EQG9_TRICO